MRNNEIQQALNTTLSSLHVSDTEAGMLLAQAKGGKKVKRKLSIVVLLSIVIVALTATAIAVTMLWENYAKEVKEIEHEHGVYIHWNTEQKQKLIQAMLDMGYLKDSEETKTIIDPLSSDDLKNEAADRLMLMLTKRDKVEDINLDAITYSVMGPSDTWTPEQRVWWHEITFMFDEKPDQVDIPTRPSGKEIQEAQAVKIAKQAIIKAFTFSNDALDKAIPVADLYTTKERPDYLRWIVHFKILREGTDHYVEREYTVIVDENGEVIGDPDINTPHIDQMAAESKALEEKVGPPIIQAFSELAETQNSYVVRRWPIELKAEYSQKVRPLVEAALISGDLKAYDAEAANSTDKLIIASTQFFYGLPQEGDIQQEDALEIAQQVLRSSFKMDDNSIRDGFSVYTYFDITNPAQRTWRFVFSPKQQVFEGTQALEKTVFRIEIDAQENKVITQQSFKWQPLLKDLEYDKLLY